MTAGFLALVGRDLHLAQRHGFDSLLAVAFFIIAVVLFPFGVGPEPPISWPASRPGRPVGGGRCWLSMLFAGAAVPDLD
jgi:heme exporter protein CcmB